MPANLLAILRTRDIASLESLAGLTIVRAVANAYDTNRTSALAQLVIDRYGSTLLEQRQVRDCIVESLSSTRAAEFLTALGLPPATKGNPHVILQRYFENFSPAKARQFVDFFDIDESYLVKPAIDDRQASFVAAAVYGEETRLRGPLHPYQKRIKDQVRRNLENLVPRQMVQMPTGAGKTATALEVAIDYLRSPNAEGVVVWVVDSNDLAEQALQTFVELWRCRGDAPINVHRYFGDFAPSLTSSGPSIVFAGFPKLVSQKNARESTAKDRYTTLCHRAKLVIVDEAHASIAETYEPVVQSLSADAQLIGLSATPGRQEDVEHEALTRLYGQTLVTITDEDQPNIDVIQYLRTRGYLADVIFEELPTGAHSAETNEERLCAELAQNPARNLQIIEQIRRAVETKEPAIVFACTKDHVFALVALCRAQAISVGFIVGETPSDHRVKMLDDFRSGKLPVLINHEILSTGVDLPNVRRLIITRPIKSPILYSQVIGRALRGPRNGGQSSNTIVNVRDNLDEFMGPSSVYEKFKRSFISV